MAENIKIKLNYSNTANSFCSIDEWEDMLYGDDDQDLDDIDDLDDDDIHPFACEYSVRIEICYFPLQFLSFFIFQSSTMATMTRILMMNCCSRSRTKCIFG